jgi:ADP-dependent NAD(P)H-hydrate dehydratase / NAD(P)H-hydrate epimerase
MKIFTPALIREWDNYTIKNEPVSSVDLMERASASFSDWYCSRFSKKVKVEIFCGPGNNGGDGLVIARLLGNSGFKVTVWKLPSDRYSADFLVNERRLTKIKIIPVHSTDICDNIDTEAVIVDALFGSGLNKKLEGVAEDLVERLNLLPNTKISVDIASGLFADTPSEGVIFRPDCTVTFQSPKLNQLLPSCFEYTGDLIVTDIGLNQEFEKNTFSDKIYIDDSFIRKIIRPRTKFSHKGTFGKALIAAGKYGSFGAAVLCARACYRCGTGLVYTLLPESGVDIMQIALPEAVVISGESKNGLLSVPDVSHFNVVAIGPGISEDASGEKLLTDLFSAFRKPLVIDASALNIISVNKELLKLIPEGSILTPHPKEFERLIGKFRNDYEKLEKLKNLAAEIKGFVVLKGAHSVIATPEGIMYFNSTGNPGMATGGSGDVLTGIIAGLMAQGYTSEHAAILGVYLHGYAGDKAGRRTGLAPLLASDIIEGIKDFYLDYENR